MKFLGRARKMMRGWGPSEAAAPQYYTVSCAAGHRLQGERIDAYQALRCPTCGEGIFVLPRSPLPDPPAPTLKPSSKRAREAIPVSDDGPIALSDPPLRPSGPLPEEDEAELEWLDPFDDEDSPPPASMAPGVSVEFDPEMAMDSAVGGAPALGANAPGEAVAAPARAPGSKAKRPPGSRPRSAQPSDRASSSRPRPAAAAGAPNTRPMIAVPPPRDFGEWVRKHRHLLIFSAVLLVVVGTISVQYRKRRLRDLPLIAEIGRLEGLPALDAGDFDTAHRKLSEARRAVEQLGGAYEGTAEIVQAAREAEIYVDLISIPLEEIISEAARADDDEWKTRFAALYKGRSTIFDGNVADYRILSRSGMNKPRVGRVDITDFALLKDVKPRQGESDFIFGARLASVSHEGSQWVVRLEPDSGVVMRHWKALEASRWPIAAKSDDAPEGSP